MDLKLSENIRAFRKARLLTQQQLADAMGVTVGAVYKWEANLSAPDLSLLVELADLFDTSVDVLLGYEVKSNKQTETITRLKEYLHCKDKSGLAEAEKALLRYPNSFEVVHQSATLYYLFGIMTRDPAVLRRSIELLERSVLLLGQNTDPEIGELSLYSDIAGAYSSLGDEEKALEILKRNNPRGVNNDVIGILLAGSCDRPGEAVDYLSIALVDALASLVRIATGYMNVYFKREDFAAGEAFLRVTLDFCSSLKEPGKTSFPDKSCAGLYVCLAFAQYRQDKYEEARRSLRTAKRLAEAFDRRPDYAADSIRFVHTSERHTTFDSMGETAMEGVLHAVRTMECAGFTALWEEADHEG